jgi:hypothetical protein
MSLGEGTEDKPYLVGWLTNDPENPRSWTNIYKCTHSACCESTGSQLIPSLGTITMLAAMMTLVVALTSSIYSGAIGNLEEHFPGYGIDVYIVGLSVSS